MPYANHFSVEIIKEFGHELYVSGEAPKFHQCILNLLKNGIEAMPEGGNLVISCFEKDGRFAEIAIQDTGCGMSESQFAQLGEPYFSTKEEKGTGLGMMVVYKIIHEMDGRLKIRSKMNEGSEFIITIPLLNTLV